MTHAVTPRTSPRPLENFLTTPGAPLPDLAQLRAFRLGAYAYTRLDAAHPAKATLQRDFLSDTALHQQVVRELLPLFRAWREAGIDVLLFKGFYLAEVVYDAPAQRYYSDVDLLIPDAQITLASQVAREMGWLEPWSAAASGNLYSHEALHLESPNGVISLDVHRLIVHSYLPWHPTQSRLTDAVWSAAEAFVWHGLTLKTLAPADAFIVGLVLNRAWSTDAWQVRPRDYLDARYLVDRFGLTKERVEARAATLACTTTFDLFLERCNPFRRHLNLRPPSRLRQLRWTLRVSHERRPSPLERRLLPLLLAPQVLTDMLLERSTLQTCWRLLRRQPVSQPIPTIIDRVRALPERARRPVFRVARGVHWLVVAMQKIGGITPNRVTELRAVATWAALRRRGYPALLVEGLVGDSGAVRTHFWVELDDVVVAYSRQHGGPYRYQIRRRYSGDGTTTTASSETLATK